MIKYSEMKPVSDFYDRCCDEQRYACPECGGTLCIFCEDGCPECGQTIDFSA